MSLVAWAHGTLLRLVAVMLSNYGLQMVQVLAVNLISFSTTCSKPWKTALTLVIVAYILILLLSALVLVSRLSEPVLKHTLINSLAKVLPKLSLHRRSLVAVIITTSTYNRR